MKKLVLWIAVAMRSLLDLQDKSIRFDNERCCGEYWADFEKNKDKVAKLTLRQACNSVIHAKEILPYRLPSRDSEGMAEQFYVDRITIRGVHRGKNTRAQLDIIEFVKIANTVINSFQENNHADR